MLRRIFLFSLLALFLSTLPTSKLEEDSLVSKSGKPEPKITAKVAVKKLDNRAKILKDYLAQYNSPLQYHAQDFIDAADTYQLDWRLMPAISGVESTFGKASYGFNGWGWGGSNLIVFNGWRDGIFTISKGLKERYVDKGLTEPYSMNKIYAASPTWGTRVTKFMNDMHQFSQKYQSGTKEDTSSGTVVTYKKHDTKIAYNSALLQEQK